MKQFIFLSALLFTKVIFISCNGSIDSESSISSFNYGTESDAARYYYLEGWKKIMDEGRWTESELAFRKAIKFDDQFALGKILVGRISQDFEEREKILEELKELPKEERSIELLLEVYKASVNFMNLREQNLDISPVMREAKDSIAEANHRMFVNIYPQSIYEKAEYIEILHSRYGAQVTLDTLKNILNPGQGDIPFFVSYEATLQAEMGNYGKSGQLINKLDSLLDENAPARYFTRAAVYEAMDSIAFAKALAEQAYQLDTNHLLAKGLLERLRLRESRHRDEEM